LYIRQIAWAKCIPEGDDRRTREDRIIDAGGELDLPDCDAEHIVSYLFQIGPHHGGAAIPHSEIESWQRNTGIELDFWEATILRRLSWEYLAESMQSDAAREAPFTTEQKIQRDREQIAALIKNTIGQKLRH
jgi:hypothetical protein